MKTLFSVFITAAFTITMTFISYIAFDTYLATKKNVVSEQTNREGEKEKPLEKYSITNLAKRTYAKTEIILEDPIATTSAYIKYPFYYYSEGKKVTGIATIPIRSSLSPVIVQFRGYVDREKYSPGMGTSRSAEVFAQNGFVSLAPDFLGYGDSDMPSSDIFEERFQTYTAALDLIHAIPSLPFIDSKKIGIWGHSNGGHIALTIAEVLQTSIPITLWAPVTKYFPYSILFFTDEAEDGGKTLRKKLAEFEKEYDTDQFALIHYLNRLVGPIQLHQGSVDEAVPLRWNDEFVRKAKDNKVDITYYTYPGADHNMLGSWNTVIRRDIEFFKTELSIQ